MDKLMVIRAGIFFVAGLPLILFTENMMKLQNYILKKSNIKYRDSKRTTRTLGVIFWVVSAVLLIISFNS